MWPRWAGVKSGGAVLLAALSVGAVQQTTRRLPAPAPERRLALVVGNNAYVDARLRNAVNDARAIGAALEELGFRVTPLEDATRAQFSAALARFGGELGAGDVALVYYAGHGVQIEGENFLVPVDFGGRTADAVRLDAVRASEVQAILQRARVGMLVLDACRTNPYAGTRAGGGTLAPMEARGILIAYAAAAGQTASDAPDAINGLFTTYLLEALRVPGLRASEVFRRVRQGVYEASVGRQFPAVYDNLLGDFVFRLSPAAAQDPDLARREELALWESIKDSRNPTVLEDYLRQYPSGRFRAAAEARLEELRRSPPALPPPTGTGARAAPPDRITLASSRGARWSLVVEPGSLRELAKDAIVVGELGKSGLVSSDGTAHDAVLVWVENNERLVIKCEVLERKLINGVFAIFLFGLRGELLAQALDAGTNLITVSFTAKDRGYHYVTVASGYVRSQVGDDSLSRVLAGNLALIDQIAGATRTDRYRLTLLGQ